MVVISCHLLGAPIYFGVDERVQDLYVVWDQLRRNKKKRTQIGRSEVGQELSWAWLKGWEVNLAAFPPHFANVSSQDQAASAPTPPPSPFNKKPPPTFFLLSLSPFTFQIHLPQYTFSPSGACWPETKLSLPRTLPALQHSVSSVFFQGCWDREGWHSTWRKWGPCQCIFMTCQSEAQWGSGGCLERNRRCWWPYSLQSPLGIILTSTATLSWVNKARIEELMTTTTLSTYHSYLAFSADLSKCHFIY